MFNKIKKLFTKDESLLDQFLPLCSDTSLVNIEALEVWLAYKWQVHKTKYRTSRPVNDLIKAGDFDEQMVAVRSSIKKGYQGIFFEGKRPKAKSSPTISQINFARNLIADGHCPKIDVRTLTKKQASKFIDDGIKAKNSIMSMVKYEQVDPALGITPVEAVISERNILRDRKNHLSAGCEKLTPAIIRITKNLNHFLSMSRKEIISTVNMLVLSSRKKPAIHNNQLVLSELTKAIRGKGYSSTYLSGILNINFSLISKDSHPKLHDKAIALVDHIPSYECAKRNIPL